MAFRRRELGLSREEVAARAGISSRYLQYLEENPAEVPPATVAMLASALETGPRQLLGKGPLVPPGRRPATGHPVLEKLGRAECEGLLLAGGVGRIVLVEARGPVAIPVNFAVVEGDVVLRTSADSSPATADGQRVGFEVDQLDEAFAEGWSVVVTGVARRVSESEELSRLQASGIETWTGEGHDVYLRISTEEISGRRLRGAVGPASSGTASFLAAGGTAERP